MWELAKAISKHTAHTRTLGIIGLIWCPCAVAIWFVIGIRNEPEQYAVIVALPWIAYFCWTLANTPGTKQPTRIPDLPPVPRDPHGATILSQMLISKFRKSRSG